ATAGATGDFDRAAVLGDDLLDNRQADPCAGLARFFRFFRAIELLENLAHLLLIHADALILHRDTYPVAIATGEYHDFSVLRRILNGIRQQIVTGVLHQLAIAGKRSIHARLDPDSDL